jgi:hypothetical protein
VKYVHWTTSEEVRQLRAMLLPPRGPKFPERWKLAPGEARVLASLYTSQTYFRTHQQLHLAAVKFAENGKNVHPTYVTKIRKKTSLIIENEPCVGYRLTERDVAIIREAISDAD